MVWGVFTRLLGVIFLIAFGSVYSQLVPGFGRRGLFPVEYWFRRISADFPTVRRYLYFPTLLWINHSDAALRAIGIGGMLSAALVIYGGPYSFVGILGCYVFYLSLDLPVGLLFPWDCVLLEAGFMGLFLAPTLPLPELAAVAPPQPIVAWAYRLLLLRVMLGFGKFKFTTSSREDWGYLKGFLIYQPLPSYVGWFMHKLPIALLKVGLFAIFLVEIPVPFLLFFPGLPGVMAQCSSPGSAGIQLCGSFATSAPS
jgi:hypothetical protein